ncbi:hypothetical protein ACTXT7_002114 [Hymenolepis weldensis]
MADADCLTKWLGLGVGLQVVDVVRGAGVIVLLHATDESVIVVAIDLIELVIALLEIKTGQNIVEGRRKSSSSPSTDEEKKLKKSHLRDIDRKIREARKKEEHEKRVQEQREREKREAEERERELEAARQLEERVSAAYEAALVDRATELREELERLYQAEIEKRVKQRIEEIERELQRAHEEKRRVEEEERRKQEELERILEENNRKLMEARKREDIAFHSEAHSVSSKSLSNSEASIAEVNFLRLESECLSFFLVPYVYKIALSNRIQSNMRDDEDLLESRLQKAS